MLLVLPFDEFVHPREVQGCEANYRPIFVKYHQFWMPHYVLELFLTYYLFETKYECLLICLGRGLQSPLSTQTHDHNRSIYMNLAISKLRQEECPALTEIPTSRVEPV